jgi:type IV secretion system protein VirD4
MPVSTAPKPLFAGIELLEVDLEQALAPEGARQRPTVADRRLGRVDLVVDRADGDEAPSIAPLPGLPALVADGRGRGIVVIVAMQSISQAEARWGRKDARTIRNAASGLMVFGGLSVATDPEELSKLCGTRLVEHASQSVGMDGRSSISRHHVEEPVLSPAAIHGLEVGVALMLFGRLPPVLSYLPGIWERDDGPVALAEEARTRVANDAARTAQRVGPPVAAASHDTTQRVAR